MGRNKTPKHAILRSVDEFEMITSPQLRAEAIYYNQFRGRCERSIELIKSLEDVGIIGTVIQVQIDRVAEARILAEKNAQAASNPIGEPK